MGTGSVTQVVLVDDHPAILAGVKAWMTSADPPVEVVASGTEAGPTSVQLSWSAGK